MGHFDQDGESKPKQSHIIKNKTILKKTEQKRKVICSKCQFERKLSVGKALTIYFNIEGEWNVFHSLLDWVP